MEFAPVVIVRLRENIITSSSPCSFDFLITSFEKFTIE